MAIKDLLLTLTSYPDQTPVSVIERAVSLAELFDTHMAAISCEVHVRIPGSFLSFGTAGGIAAGEAHRSRTNAQALLAAFDSVAERAGVRHETILERSLSHRIGDRLVEYARLRDLTIVPVPDSYDQWHAEAIIFGSGRPTLVLPASAPSRALAFIPSSSPGTSLAPPRERSPMPCRYWKGRTRCGSSR